MNEEKCSGCKFWGLVSTTGDYGDTMHPDDYMGECRRYPPAFRENGLNEFPGTTASVWCGEFKTKTVGASIPVAIEKSL